MRFSAHLTGDTQCLSLAFSVLIATALASGAADALSVPNGTVPSAPIAAPPVTISARAGTVSVPAPVSTPPVATRRMRERDPVANPGCACCLSDPGRIRCLKSECRIENRCDQLRADPDRVAPGARRPARGRVHRLRHTRIHRGIGRPRRDACDGVPGTASPGASSPTPASAGVPVHGPSAPTHRSAAARGRAGSPTGPRAGR